MWKRSVLAALAAGLLSGCVVHVEDRRPRPVPPPPPPPPAPAVSVVYTCTWHDVRYVIWREYFGCDDYEIYFCESLWGYDDDDLLVLLYISRVRRVPLRVVVYEYDRHHRDLFAVALFFRMTGDEFFVAGVAPGSCPPPYGRAYGYYWKRERGYRLSNEEVRALVHLRIGVEFYGYAPHDYFREHERVRASGGQVHVFRELAIRDYRKAGSGGKDVHQAPLRKTERPWEVSNRQEWERRREEARERARAREAQEPPRHPEAERARRQFEEAERARREEALRKAREEEERRRREAAESPQRRQEEERRKKEAEEAARRAREEELRRQAEEPRKREEQQKREDTKKKDEPKRRDDPRRR